MRSLGRSCSRILSSRQCRYYTPRSPPQAQRLDISFDTVPVPKFLERSQGLTQPLLLKAPRGSSNSHYFPATTKWFDDAVLSGMKSVTQLPTLSPRIAQFRFEILTYELSSPQKGLDSFRKWLAKPGNPFNQEIGHVLETTLSGVEQNGSSAVPGRRFVSFHAPLGLLLEAVKFNANQTEPVRELYIAQAQLTDLPSELQNDLPTPALVQHAGKGDIYNSSIWLGLEPTFTPLHRDPNPNLFCQLCSGKTIRFLPPNRGQMLYDSVQSRLGRAGNSRIRYAEMMQGQERQILHDAIWEPCETLPGDLLEARLEPGDGIFIPLGWWHSVKSQFADGRLNASVNWWFR